MTAKSRVKPLILIIEDEPTIAVMVEYNLQKAGFEVAIAADGDEGMMMAEDSEPDLILLDWMLPGITGVEICRRIRVKEKIKNIPIIMLTARGEESDKMQGLDSGADDYIVKPFSPGELVSRINAIFRRMRPAFFAKSVEFYGIRLDMDQNRTFFHDKEVILSPTEFMLLQYFMEKPERVFSREQLLNRIRGIDAYIEPRTIDVHIGRLRKSLSKVGANNYIRTVRLGGYSLSVKSEE